LFTYKLNLVPELVQPGILSNVTQSQSIIR